MAQVRQRDVFRMLDKCAPGYTARQGNHSVWIVQYNGKTWRALPDKAYIDKGWVRSLARHFGIMECAREHLDLN